MYNIKDLVTLKYLFTTSDEMSYYKTIDFQKKPVSVYITAILDQTTEWGYITLTNINSNIEERIKYRYGEIISGTLTDWLDKTVVGITYDGGWFRGDWEIRVE